MEDFLRRVPLFAKLPEADLKHLAQIVEEVRLLAGEKLFAEGSPGDKAYIMREGELEIIKTSGGREVLLAVHSNEPGMVIGEMALLEEAPRMASVRARTDSVLLAIHKEHFNQLLEASPAATQAILHMALERWRHTESRLRQSEKMAQLGTLTAGVAHELNNPAAAVNRCAEQLQSAFTQFGQAHVQLSQLGLTETQQDALRHLVRQAQEQAVKPLELDALARCDRECELETWLEERAVADAWELAPTLANLNYDVGKLSALAEHFAPYQLATVIGWLNVTYTTYNLLSEIGQSAGRISEIVSALKSYAYLDQAPTQAVDIHQSLNDTLLVLGHKLENGISVQRHYAHDLPKIDAYGSELNQVWTNIIDNAVDAMAGQGEITIRTRRDRTWVVVEIEDNGPGIPPEIQSRIFDPFFTTKPPGQGIGMGLDHSYSIVVHKHRGDIEVTSQPGKTCFRVRLPVNL